ncbi:MAG: hypothetical protein LBK99_07485 [Opitutaceae bacterium]|jgi:hypothetical protein|nr:hypothetical protein [Opitutaceae bacterium]
MILPRFLFLLPVLVSVHGLRAVPLERVETFAAPSLDARHWQIPAGAEARHTFRYSANDAANDTGGVTEMLIPWAALPAREVMRGKGWSVMRGAVASEPFAPGEALIIESSQAEGRIYAAWWLPEETE